MFTFSQIYHLMKQNDNLHRDSTLNNYAEHFIATNVLSNKQYTGISIDSRNIEPGQIFLSLKGEEKDGHNFAAQAIEKANSFLIGERMVFGVSMNRQMLVKSTEYAFELLADFANERFKGIRIAITGSAGKTTTKNMLKHMLDLLNMKCYAGAGNFNTVRFGLPLSLINADEQADVGVFELGMSEPGQIEQMSYMLKPNISVVTAIQAAHMANFENLGQIAYAKGEIFKHTLDAGIVCDGRYGKLLKKLYPKMMIFGQEDADAQLLEWTVKEGVANCKANVCGQEVEFIINHPKKALAMSALICLLIADYLKLNLHAAAKTFQTFKCVEGRGALSYVLNKTLLIDDSYNANPDSMIDAVETFKTINADFRLAILGQMEELGAQSEKQHMRLYQHLKGLDCVILMGEKMLKLYQLYKQEQADIDVQIIHASNLLEIFNTLKVKIPLLPAKSAILVKGSNSCNLNKIVDYLQNY